jgi:hypothetical protein
MITKGTLCTHEDSVSKHRAIVLNVLGTMAHALFVTSKTHWNLACRLMTPAEHELFCMDRTQWSYVAPVVRDIRSFRSPLAVIEHPNLDAYRLEFADAFAPHFIQHLRKPLHDALRQLEAPRLASNEVTALTHYGLAERVPDARAPMYRRTPLGDQVIRWF